jgi:hypothetical protein
MEQDGLDFFSSPREAAEARMRSLARKASVRKARAKAELQFRSEEVAANWRTWKDRLGEVSEFYSPSLMEAQVFPHWRAGVRYADAIISALGAAALEDTQLPASKFEGFLRECAAIVAARTYAAKLQPYDSLPLRKVEYAVANFHQLVRAAVAAETARPGLEAWRRYNETIEADTASEPMETAAPAAVVANSDRNVDEPVASEPDGRAQDREARLQAFLVANDASIAAVSETALVHKPDMQRWRRGELSGDSVMSRRIENVLAGKTPLKADPEKRAPAA